MLPNLSRLSRLEVFELGNCTRLQELPDLPSNIVLVDARNCISLKNVSLRNVQSFLLKDRLIRVNFVYIPYITILIIENVYFVYHNCTHLKMGFC